MQWADVSPGRVLWSDATSLVLDKPPGISVMGERHGTDLIRLAADAGERLHWVNRIDKVTSGAVLLARSQAAQGELTRQFARRTVSKGYLVLCRPGGLPERGRVELPLFTAASGRIRVAGERGAIRGEVAGAEGRWQLPPGAVFDHVRSHPSLTLFARLWQDEQHCLLLAVPVTGRRHQLRVHLAWIGHAIEGDPLFDKAAAARGARTCLHSWRLGFDPPGGARVELTAPPDPLWWEGAPGLDVSVREQLPAVAEAAWPSLQEQAKQLAAGYGAEDPAELAGGGQPVRGRRVRASRR